MSFKFFSGTSNPVLASDIVDKLGIEPGKIKFEVFPDNEIGVQILEDVQGVDVFAFQSIAQQPNHYLMELLILIDALKRDCAKSITVIVPYFAYARQDKRKSRGYPITAKLVADMLQTAGVDRVVTIDLHTEQIEGFFDVPVFNLSVKTILSKAIVNLGLKDLCIVAPDAGSSRLARNYASELEASLAIIDKHRLNAKQVESNLISGEVEGYEVVIIDDICSTGGTIKAAAKVCQDRGAKKIFAAFTHGLFDSRIFKESAIERIFVTDTVANDYEDSKIEQITVADLLVGSVNSFFTKDLITNFS